MERPAPLAAPRMAAATARQDGCHVMAATNSPRGHWFKSCSCPRESWLTLAAALPCPPWCRPARAGTRASGWDPEAGPTPGTCASAYFAQLCVLSPCTLVEGGGHRHSVRAGLLQRRDELPYHPRRQRLVRLGDKVSQQMLGGLEDGVNGLAQHFQSIVWGHGGVKLRALHGPLVISP
jgi:hypothetical protein